METPLPILLPVVLLHVACGLSYIFYIGLTLRRQDKRMRTSEESQAREWRRFKRRAAFLLNLEALTFIAISLMTARSFHTALPYPWLCAIGVAFIAIGIGVKRWAYNTVGPKGYYWYHFFCHDHERRYVRSGPYRYLKNPMYGVGYLQAFGLPLVVLSSWGLLAAFFDWSVVWIFYFLFERPHTASFSRNKTVTNAMGDPIS